MIRQALALGALSVFAATGAAQSLTVSEQEVDQAFKNLRSAEKALYRLIGSEKFGSSTTPFASDFFYDRPLASVSQDLKMELVEARNALVTRRVVADGRHVWGIDPIKNTYSTVRYGSYTAARPTDYEQNALQSMNVLASGQSAWPARMAREVWGGTGALYRSWIPASSNRSEYTVEGGASQTDPVMTTRSYVSTPIKKFHIYWITKAGTPTRSLTFELKQDSSSAWQLKAVYYTDVVQQGAIQRVTDWKMDIYTGVLPTPGIFTYTPAPGAKAIAGPRPNGSG